MLAESGSFCCRSQYDKRFSFVKCGYSVVYEQKTSVQMFSFLAGQSINNFDAEAIYTTTARTTKTH